MRKVYTLDLRKGGMRMSERIGKIRKMGPRTETLYFLMQFARSVRPLGYDNPPMDYGMSN